MKGSIESFVDYIYNEDDIAEEVGFFKKYLLKIKDLDIKTYIKAAERVFEKEYLQSRINSKRIVNDPSTMKQYVDQIDVINVGMLNKFKVNRKLLSFSGYPICMVTGGVNNSNLPVFKYLEKQTNLIDKVLNKIVNTEYYNLKEIPETLIRKEYFRLKEEK